MRRARSGFIIVNGQRVLSYPCITNEVHVVQGCAQTRLNFASFGVTGVEIEFRARRLIEEMRNFLYEMVLSNNRMVPTMMSMQLSMTFACKRYSVSFERVTSLKIVKL